MLRLPELSARRLRPRQRLGDARGRGDGAVGAAAVATLLGPPRLDHARLPTLNTLCTWRPSPVVLAPTTCIGRLESRRSTAETMVSTARAPCVVTLIRYRNQHARASRSY